jgi:hypothetical protein
MAMKRDPTCLGPTARFVHSKNIASGYRRLQPQASVLGSVPEAGANAGVTLWESTQVTRHDPDSGAPSEPG